MRVLLVHNYYQHFGGEDMAAESDYRLLTERGVEVRLYTRHNDEIKLYGLGDKAAFPFRTVSSGRTVAEIDDVLRDFPADVAYLHNLYPLISPSVYRALDDRGVPIVQVLHDYRPFCANGWLYTNGAICDRCSGGRHWHAAVNRCMHGSFAISAVYGAALWNLRRSKALDRVALFVCPSEFCRLQAIRNGIDASRVVVRPHHVDVDDRREDGAEPSTAGPYFLYLGRLSREKGVWTLLDAFERCPNARLRIAGTGPLDGEIRRRLADRPLSNVELLGFQTGAAKASLLRNARAVIMPSECHETFGITALESFAAGRPVIASDAGALPYLVKDGVTGLVFERANAVALAMKILALLENETAAAVMGRAGSQEVALKYSREKAAGALIDIFDAAVATSGRSRSLDARLEESALPRR